MENFFDLEEDESWLDVLYLVTYHAQQDGEHLLV